MSNSAEITPTDNHQSDKEEVKRPKSSHSDSGKKDKKGFEKPKTNRIQIASSKPANFYVFISKLYMREFETVEIHALGNAISTAVLTCENLVR